MSKYSGNYNWLVSHFGEVMDKHQDLGKSLRDAGPLSTKHGHLIQLAAAATNRSEGAVHSHTKQALGAGATAEEVYHTLVLLTSTVGFPTVAAALSWAREVVEGS